MKKHQCPMCVRHQCVSVLVLFEQCKCTVCVEACNGRVCLCLVALRGLVCVWKREADMSASGYEGQDSSVGDNVPGECQSDVLIGPESVPIIKEEVFGLHVSEVQSGVFTSKNNLIPQHHLVQRIAFCGILSRQVEKQLFHIPVKNWLQISREVKGDETQITAFSGSCEVINVLQHDFRDVDVHRNSSVFECCGNETAES